METKKSKEKLFIDTEFNGFGGELISMALVGDNHEFYEVIELSSDVLINDWVKINVYPKLEKKCIDYKTFQKKLEDFLQNFPDGFILIADWPDDLKYFLQSIMLAPGKMMDLPSFEMKVEPKLNSFNSELPHNALYDARAIKMKAYFTFT